eukprot:1377359-Prymnesium_polylepis.2
MSCRHVSHAARTRPPCHSRAASHIELLAELAWRAPAMKLFIARRSSDCRIARAARCATLVPTRNSAALSTHARKALRSCSRFGATVTLGRRDSLVRCSTQSRIASPKLDERRRASASRTRLCVLACAAQLASIS